ncbi:MAG: class I SAM-dependent methyltransferase [Candidatus Eisenbacteria bacterium]|nr:class I SAM-dependent methyltransferase [Candidatus Eisenbacteria bacterium]
MKAAYYAFLLRQGLVEFSKGLPYSRCAEYPAVVEKLALTPDDHLLDVGSRYSPLPQVLALRYGCKVTAVDPEPNFRERQLKMARRVPAARRLVDAGKLDFHVADAGTLAMPDGTFSKVSCISVLEHIVDETVVVRELGRVLAPTGRLVLSVPYDPWRDQPKYYRTNAYVTHESNETFYMRYYNDENLVDRLVVPSGLKLLYRETFGEPGFNAHNLLFGNDTIPWYVRRACIQPLAPLAASLFIRKMEAREFRRKVKMYTADTALLVLGHTSAVWHG